MTMKAPKTSGLTGTFELCPAGVQQLICCDVIDLGMEKNNMNGKEQPRVRLRFQSTRTKRNGRRFIVQRKFVWSMYKTAGLRKFIETWRGRPMTDKEADDFDFERLIGVNGFADVAHVTRNGIVYADIMHMMRLPPGVPKVALDRYIRIADRPAGMPAAGDGYPEDDMPPPVPPGPRHTSPPPPPAAAVTETYDDPFDGDASPDAGDFNTEPDVDALPVADDDIPF